MTILTLWSIAILGLFVPNILGNTDYCKITCSSAKHTACGGCPISGIILDPKSTTGLTQEEQNEILRVHNEKRNQQALGKTSGYPKTASNIQKLTWDNELAYIAQCWANSGNKMSHDSCRNVDRFSVGQNLGAIGSTSFDSIKQNTLKNLVSSVNSWFDEYKLGNEQDMEKFTSASFNKGIGHFSQVVWAQTNKIGCGKSYYKDGKFYWILLVCNYGPTGNFISQSVYKFGRQCSACPSGKSCDSKYPGLCA